MAGLSTLRMLLMYVVYYLWIINNFLLKEGGGCIFGGWGGGGNFVGLGGVLRGGDWNNHAFRYICWKFQITSKQNF